MSRCAIADSDVAIGQNYETSTRLERSVDCEVAYRGLAEPIGAVDVEPPGEGLRRRERVLSTADSDKLPVDPQAGTTRVEKRAVPGADIELIILCRSERRDLGVR